MKEGGTYLTLDALNVPAASNVDEAASFADGLALTGNMVFNQGNPYYAYYNDIGSQWLTYTGDAEWSAAAGGSGNGGCGYIGHISFTGGYAPDGVGAVPCGSLGSPTDVTFAPNTTTPTQPTATTALPLSAGVEPSWVGTVYAGLPAHVGYSNPSSGTTTASTTVLVVGGGFVPGTSVSWGSLAATSTTVESASLLTAVAPAGANLADLTVSVPGTTAMSQVDDSDTGVLDFGGTSWASGGGALENAVTQHYTTANGDHVGFDFTGTGFNYITAEDPNRGPVTISVDGQTQTDNCYAELLVYKQVCASVIGLVSGNHVVTISKSGGAYMSVDALQVFGAPDHNVAVGTTASQSSTLPQTGGITPVASLANDGNTDGNFFDGSVSHTGDDQYAWWQVDLGAGHGIDSINVYNRTDCCGNRLTDYWVFVSGTPFNTALTPSQQSTQSGVWSVHETGQAGSPTTIPSSLSGRYVMIQLATTNYLALAEVRVYAHN